MTIADAAKTVLKDAGRAMKIDEIYNEIINRNLYTFGAKNPKSVLSQAIKEKSDANTKAKSVIFKYIQQGMYTLAN